jgi:pseudouridine-5'-phosphate glycosidase
VSTDETISSRPIFAAVAVIVVLVAGGIGAIVGASGQNRAVSMDLLGVVSFQMTPVSMAAFGMVVTASVLALLFGLVSVAARYDDQTGERA